MCTYSDSGGSARKCGPRRAVASVVDDVAPTRPSCHPRDIRFEQPRSARASPCRDATARSCARAAARRRSGPSRGPRSAGRSRSRRCRAARRRSAVPRALGDHRLGIVGVAHEHQHAVVVRAAVGDVRAARRSASRCCARRTRLAGVARAVHAGRAVQRVDADARIVGERRQLRVRARVARLGERVLDERRRAARRRRRCRARACATTSMPSGASRRRNSRSLPALLDARTRRSISAVMLRRGASRPSACCCAAISCAMPRAASSSSASSCGARERRALRRALHLDEAAAAGHHDVHVGIAGRVLGVVEVEHGTPPTMPTDTAATKSRSGSPVTGRAPCTSGRVGERDARAGDRRAARAAVGLQHVAVDADRALAEPREVGHRAQAAADQPLDLLRASRLLASAASRRVRVCVERGSMPYSAVIQPLPLPLRNAGTPSSTLAVHSTRVSPSSTSTEPSACRVKPRVMRSGRSWSGDARSGDAAWSDLEGKGAIIAMCAGDRRRRAEQRRRPCGDAARDSAGVERQRGVQPVRARNADVSTSSESASRATLGARPASSPARRNSGTGTAKARHHLPSARAIVRTRSGVDTARRRRRSGRPAAASASQRRFDRVDAGWPRRAGCAGCGSPRAAAAARAHRATSRAKLPLAPGPKTSGRRSATTPSSASPAASTSAGSASQLAARRTRRAAPAYPSGGTGGPGAVASPLTLTRAREHEAAPADAAAARASRAVASTLRRRAAASRVARVQRVRARREVHDRVGAAERFLERRVAELPRDRRPAPVARAHPRHRAHGADAPAAASAQMRAQRAADEAAGPGDDDRPLQSHVRPLPAVLAVEAPRRCA